MPDRDLHAHPVRTRTTGVKRGRELQDGVFAFEIFSKVTAKQLIDVIETWSDHVERTLPRSRDVKGGL